jgi:GMP synthase (glutamine-hydrolysing)
MRPILLSELDELLPGSGLLGERLDALGVPSVRVQAWSGALAGVRARDHSGIAALGGNQHAWDEDGHPYLATERELLAEAVDHDVPVLGVCLGAQLLARVLGGEVRQGPSPEIGWLEVSPAEAARSDPLFAHLVEPVGVFQWHLDELVVPDDATLLASSELYPCQAFRRARAWGLQFHPEVGADLFEQWIVNHPGACARHGIDEGRLRAEVRAGSANAASTAFRERLFDAFIAVAERQG